MITTHDLNHSKALHALLKVSRQPAIKLLWSETFQERTAWKYLEKKSFEEKFVVLAIGRPQSTCTERRTLFISIYKYNYSLMVLSMSTWRLTITIKSTRTKVKMNKNKFNFYSIIFSTFRAYCVCKIIFYIWANVESTSATKTFFSIIVHPFKQLVNGCWVRSKIRFLHWCAISGCWISLKFGAQKKIYFSFIFFSLVFSSHILKLGFLLCSCSFYILQNWLNKQLTNFSLKMKTSLKIPFECTFYNLHAFQ